MTNWFKRFGILTVVGALLCGAMLTGCGGGGDDDDDAAPTTPKKDAGGGDE